MKKVLFSVLGLFLFFSICSTVFASTIYWPTTSKEINSGFGMRIHPISGELTMHNGIDIAALKKDSQGKGIAGDPVRAMHNGVISRAGLMSGYGLVVMIDHVGSHQINYKNVQSVYAHLDSLNANTRTGETVSGGTTIGTMGKSGDVTGVHLHFETRDCATPECVFSKSIPHNPMSWYSGGITTLIEENHELLDENYGLYDVELIFEKPYFYPIEE